jgi:predicted AAA+ superfamily ATPase
MSYRSIYPHILADLGRGKMVLLSGPRQCGQTTLAKSIGDPTSTMAYYNWDVATHRQNLKGYKLD